MKRIPNGRSKGHRASEFDPKQLRRGMHVEMEHTTDPKIAQRIAMDHLVEDPKYYVKLATVHLDSSKRRAFGTTATTAVPCSHISRTVRSLVGTLIGGGAAFAASYAIMAARKPKAPVLSATTPAGATGTTSEADALAMTNYNNELEKWAQLGSMVQWGALLVGSTFGGMIGGRKPECAA